MFESCYLCTVDRIEIYGTRTIQSSQVQVYFWNLLTYIFCQQHIYIYIMHRVFIGAIPFSQTKGQNEPLKHLYFIHALEVEDR